MRIYLKIGHQKVFATLRNSKVAAQFAEMLPLKITLYDLFHREKFGHLPDATAFPAIAARTKRYALGDIICWPRGPDIAIFFKQNGRAVSGQFHVLGRIDYGAEVFEKQGPIDVEIALVMSNSR